jgi:formylglycine-generating enzyme required for sulfatase activity
VGQQDRRSSAAEAGWSECQGPFPGTGPTLAAMPATTDGKRRAAVALTIAGLFACGSPPRSIPQPLSAAPQATATSPVAVPSPEASAPGRMAHVPEGTLRIGSEFGKADERPVHAVHISAFDMDVTEVTVAQYDACVHAGACLAAGTEVEWAGITPEDRRHYADMCNADRPDRQDHPINCVDWSAADAFCRWGGKRLPTEEEWEYAACGGECSEMVNGSTQRRFFMGSHHWPLTGPVAKGAVGAFGLYDMAGSVWEWTGSAYCPYDHPGCGDPRRVVRGGSWSVVDFSFVRLTDRSPSSPSTKNTSIGFRCARGS